MVQVFSEISECTIQRRWREVNTVFRLSMLSGLPMQLETAFNMLCDFSSEIVPYEKSVIYFWDETTEQVGLRVTRGEVDPRVATLPHGNIFNFWVTKFGRPLLIRRGQNTQADALLRSMDASLRARPSSAGEQSNARLHATLFQLARCLHAGRRANALDAGPGRGIAAYSRTRQ